MFETFKHISGSLVPCHPSCCCDNKEHPCSYFWELYHSAPGWAVLVGHHLSCNPFSPLVWTFFILQPEQCFWNTNVMSLPILLPRAIDGGRLVSKLHTMACADQAPWQASSFYLSNFSSVTIFTYVDFIHPIQLVFSFRNRTSFFWELYVWLNALAVFLPTPLLSLV